MRVIDADKLFQEIKQNDLEFMQQANLMICLKNIIDRQPTISKPVDITDNNIEGKWMYSLIDSEIWIGEEFNTKEQAIEAGRKEALENQEQAFCNDYFNIGQIVEVSPCGVDVDFILENVAENTADGMEAGENYLMDVDTEHQRELEKQINEVLFAWMDKYGYRPDFFKIENIEKIDLK
ncbi:hypothetical protein N494_18780 (plasmid) [Clostridium botulinum A2B7 92]|uniref:Uncharacterized protein n=1 Tax=Clostridium botulinum TaxID=1491 RepID=A0A846J6U9_CLOBO|nr:hypothetical protein [Clostridium botulinum]ACA57392.1 conserved phage protein [Clostridium botulinum A3 str. Loch Maree]KEI94157.1 hypothetical protein N494_18780 [Clostridium botulinum A2B7 92]NFH67040.1 hypothetical protein [Clostridium botulinum]NFJ09629.1 hypothetical protein [Clostridium botulinum]NFK16598.1 hypothetical protein [Clostridium botulinum]